MREYTIQNLLLLTTALAGLTACSGSGGGTGDVAAVGNLHVRSLEILSPDPTSAHELDLMTTVDSVKDTENVSISYYVINKAEMDGGKEEPLQFLVDTDVIPLVKAGTTSHHVTIVIPKEVEPRGEYYLTTKIDPLDQIEETNEDDNVPPEEQPDIVINVNRDNTNTPDFTVESVELDDVAMLLQMFRAKKPVRGLKDVPEHHGGLTVVCQVSGANSYKAVSLKVDVEVPGLGFKPLSIWDENKNLYVTTYYTNVDPGQPNHVHIDLNVPDSLIRSLIPVILKGVHNFNLRVTINAGSSIAEWENGVRRFTNRPDDVFTLPVVLIDPGSLPKRQCHAWEQNFKKVWHSKVLGTGVQFHAGTYLDGRGAVAEAEGAIPVKIFNKQFDFFHGEAYGQLSPHEPANTQFHIDVEVLGLSVYHRASKDPNYVYKDTPFKKVETITAKSTVFCGPVPVVFTTGAQGTLGYDLTFEMDSGNMKLTGTPYADLSAFASAVVHLGIAKGGVKGVMTLIRDDYVNSVSFGNVRLTNGGSSISATANMNVTNVLTGPKGRLYLFADYPGTKWCKTFLGRVPCGVRNIHKEKTLVRFHTFQKKDVLLNESITKTVSLNCN